LGHFFGYFLFGLEKKVPRLPAGTGGVKVRFSLLIPGCRTDPAKLKKKKKKKTMKPLQEGPSPSCFFPGKGNYDRLALSFAARC
jgi:hypothetical protein